MGYQDGYGLRPGRTRGGLKADRGGANELGTARSAAAGYRAAGTVTPAMAPSRREAGGGEVGSSALNGVYAGQQFKMPEAPGPLGAIATAAGTKIAGDVGGKLIDKAAGTTAGRYASHLMSGSSIPFKQIETANASADPIYSLGDQQGWWEGASGSGLPVDTGSADFYGAGDTVFADGADAAAAGADAAAGGAELGFGDVAPYAGAAMRLAKGDVEGAAGSAAGAFLGNMIAPGIGGIIGGALGGGGCFITEATMAGLGVQDDEAEPLKVLRWFRDNVLAGTPQGQQMIEEYEAIAPLVVQAVQQRPDAMEVFKQLFTEFISPAVEAVKGGDYPTALQIYAAMIAAVMPLAQQAMQEEDAMDEMGDMQGMEGMDEDDQMEMLGQDAQQVAMNPMIAQQAAPSRQSALSQFSADEEYPTPVRFGRR